MICTGIYSTLPFFTIVHISGDLDFLKKRLTLNDYTKPKKNSILSLISS